MRNQMVSLFLLIFPFLMSAKPDSTLVLKASKKVAVEQENPVVAGPMADFFSEFTLSSKPLIYNKTDGSYFFSIPCRLMDTDVERTIHYVAKDAGYSVSVEGSPLRDGDDYLFKGVTAGKKFRLEVRNGATSKALFYLSFTGLPIVQLFYDACTTDRYLGGRIIVHDPDTKMVPEFLRSKFKYRGATALGQPKKSYNIKLKGPSEEKLFKSFFGLREDNNWILDAMAVDPARMRNRVATDLWNDFATLPSHSALEKKVINGTRGRFVEVFINDQYNGLYCMTEKVDIKQLRLKKYDEITSTTKGLIYKSIDWTYSSMMGFDPESGSYPGVEPPAYDNSNKEWEGFVAINPDVDDEQSIDWKPLYEAVRFNAVSALDSAMFVNGYKSYVDLPVWLDYYLLMDVIFATANQGSNMFLYTYDKNLSNVMSVAPWDLDCTFGREWKGSASQPGVGVLCTPDQDYTQFVQKGYGENGLLRNLKRFNPDNFNEKMRRRYTELRKSYFSTESLLARFAQYKELFDKSGAGDRETALWNGNPVNLDFDAEMNYLSSWMETRLNYLDSTEFELPYKAGDSNNDGGVDILDVVNMVDYIMGNHPEPFILKASDLDGGRQVNILDVVRVIDLLLGNSLHTDGSRELDSESEKLNDVKF